MSNSIRNVFLCNEGQAKIQKGTSNRQPLRNDFFFVEVERQYFDDLQFREVLLKLSFQTCLPFFEK